jgi:hypothetical protein
VNPIRFTILGQACSKANSRELGTIKKRDEETGEVRSRAISRKSDEALAFERDAVRQIPPAARQQLTGKVRVTMKIFYTWEGPDLDESIVLDVMQTRFKTIKDRSGKKIRREVIQAGVYVNDRQVREKHIYHGIDAVNPRVEILVEPLEAQQMEIQGAMP